MTTSSPSDRQISDPNSTTESLRHLAGLTPDDEGMLSTDEYVDRVEAIAGVTKRIGEDSVTPADTDPATYDYAGIGPSHHVLDWAAKIDDPDEIEMEWREGFGCVHPDLDLPLKEPKQVAVAVAVGRVEPTPSDVAAPVVALAHSRAALSMQIDKQVGDLGAGESQ